MEELRSAMEEHMGLMADLVQKLSSELRSGIRPAYDNFVGFFHAIDWKEPWLISLLAFHLVLLIITIFSRKNTNFQMCLFLLALLGVYFAESLNRLLGDNWKKFATQNYFDPSGLSYRCSGRGLFSLSPSSSWSINTLFCMCYLIVRWKKAELRHRARLSRNKQD